ncbi:MAG: CRISPR-associated endoribonuclease Cas6 [bacterium]
MRIKLTFYSDKAIILPVHYNYILQSFIYNNIIDPYLSEFIHNKAYLYNNRRFKLFVFSKIFPKGIVKDKIITINKEFYFYISSVLDDLLANLAKSFVLNEKFYLFKNIVYLKSIEVIKYPSIFSTDKLYINKVAINLLSPITVYSTLSNSENLKKTYYYSPLEKEFYKLIKLNLLKKYNSFYLTNLSEDNFNFNLELDFFDYRRHSKVIMYKGNYVIKCFEGSFFVSGNRDIIKFAYDVGLGAKNSQGFGMFDIA